MGKIKNYYPYDYTDFNRNYIIKLGEHTEDTKVEDTTTTTTTTATTPIYTLNQAEIAEIDEALDKAITDENLTPQFRSRYFIGFVGEKLMEKFLGLKFCDMTFDKPTAYYNHHDIPDLGIGIKTILSLKGGTEGFWMNALDLTTQQLIAYISYNHAKMCWVLDKVEKVCNYERISDSTGYDGRVLVVPTVRTTLYEAPAPKRLF